MDRRRRHPRLPRLRARLRDACRGAERRRGRGARARRGACADEPRRPPLCAGARNSISRRSASARKSAGGSSRRITTTSGAPRNSRAATSPCRSRSRRKSAPKFAAGSALPEENILYFIEKQAPRLKPWQRELLRITRNISQYYYPQKQTKLMNEGCATFCHYEIVHRLHEKGLISDGVAPRDHAFSHQRDLPAGI